MRACGIIVEYNPFHNGHLYHLQETKKISNSDVVIAVMSGNFLQRGEPALVSKWVRTKMALENGVDLVIELPFSYATQMAETFAFGAVSILNSLNATSLCFGSESGTIDDFYETLAFFSKNEALLDEKVKKFIEQGYSYPKAKSLAYESFEQNATSIDLSQPNNILGYHYVRSIQKLNSSLRPHTIKRQSAQYHDVNFASESIASATSIRKVIKQDGLKTVENVVPKKTMNQLMNYKKNFQTFSDWESYFPLLKYKLLTMSVQQLRDIYGVSEGIEHRFKKYINESNTFVHFMEKVKTKRYTWTRLQRICLYILTNVSNTDMKPAHKLQPVPYLRILGMNEMGQKYLNFIKKKVAIPTITKPTSLAHPTLELDLKVSNIYQLIYPVEKQKEKFLNDYKTPPIILKKSEAVQND